MPRQTSSATSPAAVPKSGDMCKDLGALRAAMERALCLLHLLAQTHAISASVLRPPLEPQTRNCCGGLKLAELSVVFNKSSGPQKERANSLRSHTKRDLQRLLLDFHTASWSPAVVGRPPAEEAAVSTTDFWTGFLTHFWASSWTKFSTQLLQACNSKRVLAL